jgi:hypothetical protein
MPQGRVTTYLLHNGPASYRFVARLSREVEPERKRVLTGRQVAGGRPETLAIYPWPG